MFHCFLPVQTAFISTPQPAVLAHAAFNNQAETEVESSHNQSFSLQNPRVAKKEMSETELLCIICFHLYQYLLLQFGNCFLTLHCKVKRRQMMPPTGVRVYCGNEFWGRFSYLAVNWNVNSNPTVTLRFVCIHLHLQSELQCLCLFCTALLESLWLCCAAGLLLLQIIWEKTQNRLQNQN